jgi:hypothetical protein
MGGDDLSSNPPVVGLLFICTEHIPNMYNEIICKYEHIIYTGSTCAYHRPPLPGGWILGEKHAKDDDKKGHKCESKNNKKGNIE